jgi:Predicted metal-dependent phosphoesterases (PHP family)
MIDLHTHSSVSDGTDSPTELMANAAAAGLAVIALCDHDTFDGWEPAVLAAAESGVELVRGVEISAELDGQSVHLLGYGPRPDHPGLLAELDLVRQGRTERVPRMLQRLADVGLPVPAEVLARHVGDSPSVGRPHLADAMVELGYVADRREAFDGWLADDRPIFVPRYGVPLRRAVTLVRQAGGAVVIAHPWGRESRDLLTEAVLADLVDAGLDGIEVDHQDHDEATRAELRGVAAALDLLVTGSSDYHGLGKMDHELGCNTTSEAAYHELRSRVAERGGRV